MVSCVNPLHYEEEEEEEEEEKRKGEEEERGETAKVGMPLTLSTGIFGILSATICWDYPSLERKG